MTWGFWALFAYIVWCCVTLILAGLAVHALTDNDADGCTVGLGLVLLFAASLAGNIVVAL